MTLKVTLNLLHCIFFTATACGESVFHQKLMWNPKNRFSRFSLSFYVLNKVKAKRKADFHTNTLRQSGSLYERTLKRLRFNHNVLHERFSNTVSSSTSAVWLSVLLIRAVSPIIDWYMKANDDFNIGSGLELKKLPIVTAAGEGAAAIRGWKCVM